MGKDRQRRRLAVRANEIMQATGAGYTKALDDALAENNPTGSPTVAEHLIRQLLNIPDDQPTPARHQSRQEEDSGVFGVPVDVVPGDGLPTPEGDDRLA